MDALPHIDLSLSLDTIKLRLKKFFGHTFWSTLTPRTHVLTIFYAPVPSVILVHLPRLPLIL